MVVRKLIPLILASLLLAGCGDYWADQGAASRMSSEARLRNAQAAILDAEARNTMADSQADALRTSVDAVVDLAGSGEEYVWLFAGIAFAALAFAGWAIWATHRQPTAPAPPDTPRHVVMLETPAGPVRMIREQQETPEQFALRVAMLAAKLSADESRLLDAPRR